jgi:succinate dehydrogenase / fumarate reductase cytochrome b subunit
MKAESISFFRYLSHSTAKKFLMALSGAALFGFIVGHLAGNLQIFQGQDKINSYAVFLRSLGGGLWIVRIGLIVMAVIHIWTSIKITQENRAARPQEYAHRKYVKASLASRTMFWSGLVVLSFIIYHLLHFTFIKVHPQFGHLVDAQGRHDVYSMMVLSFMQWPISLAYLISVFLVCFHLSHGISSMFQSLGFNNGRLRPVLAVWGTRVAWVIFAGYAAIPLGVLFNVIKLPPGVQP